MIVDIIIVAVVIGIAVVIVNSIVASSSVGKGAAVVAKEVSEAEKLKKAAEKSAKPKLSKKEVKRIKAEEAELEELVAKEARSVSGMARDKSEVITLESIRDKRESKTRKIVEAAAVTTFTAQDKVVEKARGFKVVDSHEEVLAKKRSAEVAAAVAPVVTISKKELLDKKLGSFFRAKGGKDKKKRSDDAPIERVEKAAPSTGGVVSQIKPIGKADPRGHWGH